jgi:hypothetical protein
MSEPEYEDIEEMHAALRDHLRATDITSDTETIATLFSVVRYTAEALGGMALVLRRHPSSAERIAGRLTDLANGLNELVLDEPELLEEE